MEKYDFLLDLCGQVAFLGTMEDLESVHAVWVGLGLGFGAGLLTGKIALETQKVQFILS